jgi:co-chaperonin GroES (HSP10)
MNILPLKGQCLVELLPRDTTEFGLITIPESVEIKDGRGKLPPVRAIVRRLGRWPQKPNGLAVLPEFSPGDCVIVSQYAGQKLKRLDDKFRLVRVEDVLAVLK